MVSIIHDLPTTIRAIAAGGQSTFNYPFKIFRPSDLVVTVNGVAAGYVATPGSAAQFSTIYNDDEGGSVSFGAGLNSGDVVVIARAVVIERVTQFPEAGPVPMSSFNREFDRHIAIMQDLRSTVSRAALVAIGGTPPVLPSREMLVGKYLAGNADGNIVPASGTGNDASLRFDLAQATGASMIGNSQGGSVEVQLAALRAQLASAATSLAALSASDFAVRQQNAKQVLSHPPLCGGRDYSHLLPTLGNPLATSRDAAGRILVRLGISFASDASCTEMVQIVLLDPEGYANVSGGWQTVVFQGIINGALHDFFNATARQEEVPNPDFAIRLGPFDQLYHSGGEGPTYGFGGFGHGRCINDPANNQIILNGAGLNLQSLTNWPVGTDLYGTSLSITCAFYLTFFAGAALGANPVATVSGSNVITVTHTAHGLTTGRRVQLLGFNDSAGLNGIPIKRLQGGGVITVTGVNTYTMATGVAATATGSGGGSGVTANQDRVLVNYTKILTAAGMNNVGNVQATTPNVGWQDFYTDLIPVNRNAATHFKLSGMPAVAITNDGSQKINATSTTASKVQAYHAAYPTVVLVHTLSYGGPLRKVGGGLVLWGLNLFGRIFFRDLFGYPKAYVFGGSSQEAEPRTAWPLLMGDQYEFNSVNTVRLLGGGAE